MKPSITSPTARTKLFCTVGAALLAALTVCSLLIGKYPLTLEKLLAGDAMQWRVFRTLRLSRALVGAAGGFALGRAARAPVRLFGLREDDFPFTAGLPFRSLRRSSRAFFSRRICAYSAAVFTPSGGTRQLRPVPMRSSRCAWRSASRTSGKFCGRLYCKSALCMAFSCGERGTKTGLPFLGSTPV